MNAVTDLTFQDRQAEKIQDWLLAILRFAVTRDPIDQATVMATAQMMDEAGRPPDTAAFAFFGRVSFALCTAIADERAPDRAGTLRRHIARIDNPRLRRAFEAAIDLPAVKMPRKDNSRARLWEGLSSALRL